MNAQIGKTYRHCKGNLYRVIAIAKDTEITGRELVIYEDAAGTRERPCWARSRQDFEGLHSSGVPRFVEE